LGILLLEARSQRAHAQSGYAGCNNVSCVEPCSSGAACVSVAGQTCTAGCTCTVRLPYYCLIL